MSRINHSDERYMGAETDLVTTPSGAVTNSTALRLLDELVTLEPQVVELAPGVHSIFGFAGYNVAVIEGESGLIIYDTGEKPEDGEMVLELVRQLSSKPIVAVAYSHSHYAHGTRALVGENANVSVVGHPNVNARAAAAGGSATGAVFGELAPLYQARTDEQLAIYLPDSGPDAPLIPKLEMRPGGFIEVNRPVEDGEEFEIDGVRMRAFTEFWSDENACLTLFLPDHGVVLNNLFWPFMPNLYPLRGEAFRDPRIWRDGIRVIRDLEPSALHNVNGLPLQGREQIRQALSNSIDGLSFVFDQSLRGMLKGLGPDELRNFVRLPDHLRDAPQLAEIYGEISVFPPRMYVEAFGWFDRDAANMFPPAPEFEAARIVEGFGGRDAVIAAVAEAIENEEFAWAARLVNHLYVLDPLDRDVRSLKARSLREMGRRAHGSIPRAFFLGQARALEGTVTIPTLVIPEAEDLARGDVFSIVDHFRVFIDPEKSEDVEQMLSLTFTDAGNDTYGLIVRRGVCEFVRDLAAQPRQPDLSCSLERLTWAKLFVGDATPRELLTSGEIDPDGNEEGVARFLELFDPLDRTDNDSIPQMPSTPAS